MSQAFAQRSIHLLFLFICSTALAQQSRVYKMDVVRGRVLGVNLENVAGATVTNCRTADKTVTDANGIYQLNVAKGDTVIFRIARYSVTPEVVKSLRDNLNVIMIKRKADSLPAGSPPSEYKKAKRDDKKMVEILEKDARLDDKWKY